MLMSTLAFALALALTFCPAAMSMDGAAFCGPGTSWDAASAVCVAQPQRERARRAADQPTMETVDGDLVFAVAGGKRVGYDVGGKTAYYSDLQPKTDDDASARRDFGTSFALVLTRCPVAAANP